MTQKEKAELCDKAYDKVAARFGLNVANEIFTGLKESEDERIRKALIQLVNQCGEELLHPENARQMLDWLEKQGEKLPVGFYYVNSEGKKFYSDTFKYGDVILHVEKQGEQKVSVVDFKAKDWYVSKVDGKIHNIYYSADNIEPKFKVGDWVVWDNKIFCHIDNIYQGKESLMYTITDVHNMTRSYSVKGFDNNAHLWTIQDAKDGDVLVYKDEISLYKHDINNCTNQETTFGGFVFHCCYDGKRFIMDSLYSLTEQDKMDIQPATKEQQDLLFSKMKEAGYKWNAMKKELKEIHIIDEGKAEMDYCFTKMINGEKVSPIWSEEDEYLLDETVQHLEELIRIDKAKHCACDVQYYQRDIDWLKSLKDRIGG